MDKEKTPRLSAAQREKEGLRRLYLLEDLAEKKTRIYAKLLTDVDLAKTMQNTSDGHAERKQLLASMLEEI